MAVRLSNDQWADLETNFYKWCIAEGRVSLKAYHETLKGKNIPTKSGIEFKAREKGWITQAKDKLATAKVPKLEAELKATKEEQEETQKQLTTIVLTKEEANQEPAKAINLVDQVYRKVQKGFGHNVNSHTTLAEIVDNQLLGMLEKQRADSSTMLMLEEVNACMGLVGCLDKLFTINQKSALFTKEQLKELKSLHEHQQEAIILYKEQAKLTGKKDENSEKQEEAHEFFKEMQRDEGIPIN